MLDVPTEIVLISSVHEHSVRMNKLTKDGIEQWDSACNHADYDCSTIGRARQTFGRIVRINGKKYRQTSIRSRNKKVSDLGGVGVGVGVGGLTKAQAFTPRAGQIP